jgi:16S rRNA G1207 methylase RsmC
MITKEEILSEEARLLPLYQNCSLHQLLFWQSWANNVREALPNFRAELIYLAQLSGTTKPEHYQNTVDYIRDVQEFKALLGDDDSYGNLQVMTSAGLVSRDLIDSIMEIRFLEQNNVINGEMGILDIGAGYGRFAHRITTLYDNITVVCVDAVPISTAICNAYTAEQQKEDRVIVLPLHNLYRIKDSLLERVQYCSNKRLVTIPSSKEG